MHLQHQHYSVGYTSSATYFGLALPREIRSRDLKLVNANIPTPMKIHLIALIIAIKI